MGIRQPPPVVLGLAFIAGQAKAAPLPAAGALATEAGAKSALPVEKVHRRYRYWGWGPRYNYYWGPRYYYQPLPALSLLRVQVLGSALLPLLVVTLIGDRPAIQPVPPSS